MTDGWGMQALVPRFRLCHRRRANQRPSDKPLAGAAPLSGKPLPERLELVDVGRQGPMPEE